MMTETMAMEAGTGVAEVIMQITSNSYLPFLVPKISLLLGFH
jgi:hypothetical protein